MLLPVRARIFSTSRGLSLTTKSEGRTGWWLNRVSIETARTFCPNPAAERFETTRNGKSRLTYFEGLPTYASIGDLDVMAVIRRIAKANDSCNA
jgi:hypothetical protein